MRFKCGRDFARALARAEPAEQRRLLAEMTFADAVAFDAEFEAWAHDNQLPPRGEGWHTWLMMAGRGFGKTRAGAEWIEALARSRPNVRIALVGATIDDARRVMVEGVSGVLAVGSSKNSRIKWEPGIGRLKWPNGSEAQLFSGDNPDGLRGPEHDFAWSDELAKWRKAEETWDNLKMGLRRGPRPRVLVTTTPRSGPLLERIRSGERTVATGGRTSDNINLDERFVDMMVKTYGGTRLGRQELDGELIDDFEGALWTREMVEGARVTGPSTILRQAQDGPPPPGKLGAEYDRIVVGVDPSVGEGKGSDECGIVVCGSMGDALYVLEDATIHGMKPEVWANRVAAAALRWGATLVVAEANNGGALVKSVIDAAGAALKVRLVHASQGKSARAEPIALRFEAGRAFFAGEFPRLEAQLTGMIAGGGYEGPGRSPDRADAMVWAMTALSETRNGMPRVRCL